GVLGKLVLRSGWAAVSRALMRTLPRLSSARRAWARDRPFAVLGISSADVSLNGPTSTTPSSTRDARASSRDLTRTAKGMARAGTLDDFGGLNLIRATASAPGNRGTTAGSTMAHADASPRTSIVNWSTTVPELRTRTSVTASPPGVTVTALLASVAVAAMALAS